MVIIQQIKLNPGCSDEIMQREIAHLAHTRVEDIDSFYIVKKSIDARKKPEIYEVYSVAVNFKNTINEKLLCKKNVNIAIYEEKEFVFRTKGKIQLENSPVIVGMGPAGMFCGYFLAKYGYKPIIIERGEPVEDRMKHVEQFWEEGILNPNSNVQFGEGGAGTFSDGKLNTGVKDKEGICRACLQIFCEMGAAESILYDSKPHIGTDELRKIVKNIREAIISYGGTILFSTRLENIHMKDRQLTSISVLDLKRNETKEISCNQLILSIGHSARDTVFMLYQNNLQMEAKSFAIGMRVMHSQELINEAQYGIEYKSKYPQLPPVSYKLTAQTSSQRGVYSFCMCPGGYVVNASSNNECLVVNGMSYSKRDSKHANSAIVMTVTPKDYPGEDDLAGIRYQSMLEKQAYELGKGNIPIQFYEDFKSDSMDRAKNTDIESVTKEISVKGKCTFANLRELFNDELSGAFMEGMSQFGRRIRGFDADDVMLLGLESRTSSPVKIVRNEMMQSNIFGIYPCGEGAGYAGGIISAAKDGVLVAQQLANQYAPQI